ncbi:MAG TPA: LysR family transcriptional regulator [Desulfobacteria bacterium]|nr:LysR family transcriptional regulator [Desulfobacteria bacterium]
MDIRQLTYFVAVVKHNSFSKAAGELHVTQPTISKVVKGLEDELGVTLLERSTKHIELTDVGEVVAKQALNIRKSVEDLETELTEVTGLRTGKIRIGLPPMVGASFFPGVLAEFYQMYPNIAIELIEDGALAVAQSVERGSLDLGVGLFPVDETILEYFPFAEDQLMLVVHPGHRLAGKSQVRLAELETEQFIFYREDFTLHHRIWEQCLKHGFEPKVVYESSQWDFISEMVAADLGIALLPSTICRELRKDKVTSVALIEPVIPWNLGLIWRKDRYLTFATREFISFAGRHIKGKR